MLGKRSRFKRQRKALKHIASLVFSAEDEQKVIVEICARITVIIHHGSAPDAYMTSTATVSDPAVMPIGGFAFSAAANVPSSMQTVATFTDPGGPEPNSSDPTGIHYSADIAWGNGTGEALMPAKLFNFVQPRLAAAVACRKRRRVDESIMILPSTKAVSPIALSPASARVVKPRLTDTRPSCLLTV